MTARATVEGKLAVRVAFAVKLAERKADGS
jgi:hypothetical protein